MEMRRRLDHSVLENVSRPLSVILTGSNDESARELAVTRPWLAVLNAFPTLSCTLFQLKHSWNTRQSFILFI